MCLFLLSIPKARFMRGVCVCVFLNRYRYVCVHIHTYIYSHTRMHSVCFIVKSQTFYCIELTKSCFYVLFRTATFLPLKLLILHTALLSLV